MSLISESDDSSLAPRREAPSQNSHPEIASLPLTLFGLAFSGLTLGSLFEESPEAIHLSEDDDYVAMNDLMRQIM
jgi:hypothetical protein